MTTGPSNRVVAVKKIVFARKINAPQRRNMNSPMLPTKERNIAGATTKMVNHYGKIEKLSE